MNRAEVIDYLERCLSQATHNGCVTILRRRSEVFEMAIAALREQEQRERGCEYCDERDIMVMSASLMTFDLVHKGCVCWYCPNCGRKLTEPPKEGAEG